MYAVKWDVAASLAAAACPVAVLLLPWHRSGRVVRSGLELVRVAQDLGLIDSTGRRILVVGVLLTPALALVVAAAAALGHRRLSGSSATATGAVTLSCALLLRDVSPGLPGPRLTIVAGVCALVAGLRLTLRRNAP